MLNLQLFKNDSLIFNILIIFLSICVLFMSKRTHAGIYLLLFFVYFMLRTFKLQCQTYKTYRKKQQSNLCPLCLVGSFCYFYIQCLNLCIYIPISLDIISTCISDFSSRNASFQNSQQGLLIISSVFVYLKRHLFHFHF